MTPPDAKALVEAILAEASPPMATTVVMGMQYRMGVIADHATRLGELLAERDAAAEGEVELELVKGPEGTAVYLNSTRVAGPKPWGGGTITFHRAIRRADLAAALKEAPNG